MSPDARDVTLDLSNSCVGSMSRFTTSATEDVLDEGVIDLANGRTALTLAGQSVTTFVSR
jgi:O-glycosyl hydrolase